MYFIFNHVSGICQLGLGNFDKCNFARGIFVSGGERSRTQTFVWEKQTRLPQRLQQCADFRFVVSSGGLTNKIFLLAFQLQSSKFLQNRIRYFKGKKIAVKIIGIALVLASCGVSFVQHQISQQKAKPPQYSPNRPEILATLQRTKLGQRIQKNLNNAVYGKMSFLGGRIGLAFIPLTPRGHPLLVLSPLTHLTFVSSVPGADRMASAERRCGSVSVFRAHEDEALILAPRVKVTDNRRFALLNRSRAASLNCSDIADELRETKLRWSEIP